MTPPTDDSTLQFFRKVDDVKEFVFNGYNTVNSTVGKFRLIDYSDTIYGVSFVASGN